MVARAYRHGAPCPGSAPYGRFAGKWRPGELELINSYDLVEYEGHLFADFPFLDVANRWATVGSTADAAVLDEMSWQQIAAAMGDAGSSIGQALDGGAEIITAEICEVDGGQPTHICGSEVVHGYEEGLETGF